MIYNYNSFFFFLPLFIWVILKVIIIANETLFILIPIQHWLFWFFNFFFISTFPSCYKFSAFSLANANSSPVFVIISWLAHIWTDCDDKQIENHECELPSLVMFELFNWQSNICDRVVDNWVTARHAIHSVDFWYDITIMMKTVSQESYLAGSKEQVNKVSCSNIKKNVTFSYLWN